MSQYNPSSTLENYHTVGTATVSSVTEEFAVLEDYGPLTADQLQTMRDGGWRLMFPPQVTEDEPNVSVYIYTFQQENLEQYR